LRLDLDAFLADKKVFRLWPEWASSGVWVFLQRGRPGVGGMIQEDSLGISDELKRRLLEWQRHWDGQPNTERMFEDGSQPAFLAEGLEIARLLSKELGSGAAIEYELVFMHEFGKEEIMNDIYALFHDGQCVAVYPQLGPNL
jgi:hypothetical protein